MQQPKRGKKKRLLVERLLLLTALLMKLPKMLPTSNDLLQAVPTVLKFGLNIWPFSCPSQISTVLAMLPNVLLRGSSFAKKGRRLVFQRDLLTYIYLLNIVNNTSSLTLLSDSSTCGPLY